MGDIDRERIDRSVRAIYEHWSQGDINTMISYLAPDVSFPTMGSWSGAKAQVQGRDAAAKYLRLLDSALENVVYVLHEVLIDGDRAVAHRTAVGRRRDNGQRYQCDFIDFFRFRDGLVVEYSNYPDAAWMKFESALT